MFWFVSSDTAYCSRHPDETDETTPCIDICQQSMGIRRNDHILISAAFDNGNALRPSWYVSKMKHSGARVQPKRHANVVYKQW